MLWLDSGLAFYMSLTIDCFSLLKASVKTARTDTLVEGCYKRDVFKICGQRLLN